MRRGSGGRGFVLAPAPIAVARPLSLLVNRLRGGFDESDVVFDVDPDPSPPRCVDKVLPEDRDWSRAMFGLRSVDEEGTACSVSIRGAGNTFEEGDCRPFSGIALIQETAGVVVLAARCYKTRISNSVQAVYSKFTHLALSPVVKYTRAVWLDLDRA